MRSRIATSRSLATWVVKNLLVFSLLAAAALHAQISNFEHIVVMVQENRSPDNLFQGLCSSPYGKSSSCSTSPTSTQYDIQTSNWLDKTSSTGTRTPVATTLSEGFDLGHSHNGFNTECDLDTKTGICRMDGAANDTCSGTCPTRPALQYVENSGGILDPYLSLATQYGWANYMFQTNQGPSFPAHQFLFGGTSAPSPTDDAAGTFASENMNAVGVTAGCIALSSTTVKLITTKGENQKIYPCFEHETLSDLLEGVGVSWKYYTPSAGSIWTAPDAINHICEPNEPTGGNCTGSEWTSHVVINPSQVLTDISKCNLAGVSWVIPSGQNSDHPKGSNGGGPSWVASVVNAIGNNAKCQDGQKYWNNTAILILWDDWEAGTITSRRRFWPTRRATISMASACPSSWSPPTHLPVTSITLARILAVFCGSLKRILELSRARSISPMPDPPPISVNFSI